MSHFVVRYNGVEVGAFPVRNHADFFAACLKKQPNWTPGNITVHREYIDCND